MPYSLYMYNEQIFGLEKKNNLISMHDCARLDMESQIYMLRNTETKRPERQCTIHNLRLVYLATIYKRLKKIKGLVFGRPATHQADTEQKTYNKVAIASTLTNLTPRE